MKKDEGQRCVQIREFEAEIDRCSSQIKSASSVVQMLPEDGPMDAFHRHNRTVSCPATHQMAPPIRATTGERTRQNSLVQKPQYYEKRQEGSSRKLRCGKDGDAAIMDGKAMQKW
ncbi:hypothetical protein AVEN_160957-1 [Araneus ventricosus]|uniref:Uncharacterized protein n=1 Tax=Araneus ventricosus TaxID=182803 RepID=A0A4Y2KV49_ARAVE|nr:hypothetical protein AVEN_160957-1 [Araneus ventricosus]